jgi:hypothetical protein
MPQFVRLDQKHIVNTEAISCIEHDGDKEIKIHFIGRWDNVLTLKSAAASDILKNLGIS